MRHVPMCTVPAIRLPRTAFPDLVRGAALLALGAGLMGAAPRPLGAQPGSRRSTRSTPARDTLTAAERAAAREASREASRIARERSRQDSLKTRSRGDSATASAFGSPEARAILERARAARERQDSALKAYKATTTQRISTGLGVKAAGLEKLLFRGDNVAQIAWRRDVGVWVMPVGSRILVPAASDADGTITDAVTIPYFPGRETLWFPSSSFATVKTDVDDRELINPLARGAEYYYRYETGDSLSIALEGGRTIRIRELRITARRPEWRAFVGSFWFDRDGGQLVRAAYRLAADLELYDVADEQQKANAPRDSVRTAVQDSLLRQRLSREAYVKDSTARAARGPNQDGPPAWVKFAFRPAKAALDAITVEYGLYQGRFWLPRSHSATANAQVGFLRVPFTFNEKFTYDEVNGNFTLPAMPPMLRGAALDSLQRDTVITVAKDSAGQARSVSGPGGGGRVAVRVGVGPGAPPPKDSTVRMSVSKARQCATDSMWTRVETRYQGALRVAYREPCDEKKLATSAALPPAMAATETLFDEGSAASLRSMLGMSLQSGFAPQWPKLRTGIDLIRYNRIEGLSLGLGATQALGAGFTVSAVGRLGIADLHANGELSLARSAGPRTVTATVYHRLNAANPEWAGALSFGSSLPALLYGRDEGFYYRSYGAELGEERTGTKGAVSYKLFVERQWTAGDSSVARTFSFARVVSGRQFQRNILAEPLAITGVAGSWSRVIGEDPDRLRLTLVTRGEAGTGTYAYARASGDATIARPLGPIAVALTASGGSSVGRIPAQRRWYLGGLRTVRGQVAGLQDGTAYWLTRLEVGTRSRALRPVLFYDAGWAGRREAFAGSAPLRGAGVGLSVLDGLFRIDVARGLTTGARWRTDLYFTAPL